MAIEPPVYRIRLASTLAAWLLWAVAAVAAPAGNEPDDGRHARVRLTFGVDVPRLDADDAIRMWVATDLHRRLGLDDTDVLTVEDMRSLGDYRVVRVSQKAHGFPIVYRESRLFLNSENEPLRLLGYHSSFPGTPVPRPRLSVAEAVSMAGGTEHDASSSRLVFWPAGDRVRLSYELEGAFPGALRRVAPFERVVRRCVDRPDCRAPVTDASGSGTQNLRFPPGLSRRWNRGGGARLR